MKVYKRDGTEQEFDISKIRNAINKANKSVDNALNDVDIERVMTTIQSSLKGFTIVGVEDIQDIVERALMKHNKYDVAKSYILYRQKHAQERDQQMPAIFKQAISLLNGTNEQLRGENANKHMDVVSSMRDYLAGLMCKTIFEYTAPKHVVKAHKKKLIHFHDADYSPAMPLWNCDLINIEDMLMNGFQMNDTHIDSPKTFSTACNLISQISLIVSGSQYGGQTISWAHLAPFVERTREHYRAKYDDVMNHVPRMTRKFFNVMLNPFKTQLIEYLTRADVKRGVKTYQYQIICHQSSNGQTPFVSNNLCLREAQNDAEMQDLAMIFEEILNRRIHGVKDHKLNWTGPLFPKLLYWMCDGLNVRETDKYFYLTQLAARANAERCQPDINSERKSREIKAGQIIPSMGCRSWLKQAWETRIYPSTTKFYWQYITDNNVKYDGAYKANFDYTRPATYDVLPDDCENVVINFRGNSGWPTSRYHDDEVAIMQPIVYGRFNSGVVTANLPYAALLAREIHNENNDIDIIETFFNECDKLLETCRDGLRFRTQRVMQIKAKNVPIHLMYGAIARMNENDTVADWVRMHPTLMSTSFGFIGLYECCRALIGESNTTPRGRELSKRILRHINDKLSQWSIEDNLNYSLYGTPEENLTTSAATALRRDFGEIPFITDKDYVVNSYHVDPREEIDAFTKLAIEGEYLSLCSGGAVSYIETADMRNNPQALIAVMQYMYEHIAYAEFNRIMGHCYTCGYDGVIPLIKSDNGKFVFKCPCCNETRDENMHVDGRLCGYLGQINAGNTSHGRLADIYARVIHFGQSLIKH